LLSILAKIIKDDDALWLLKEIVGSFHTPGYPENELKGIPIGNLTSQLFANIYMNEFDQFMKQGFRVKQYIRYTDDFLIVSADRSKLERLLPYMREFLEDELRLSLHPRKIILRKFSQGIDYPLTLR
jgi:retron-type reverse transcriptase